MKRVGRALVVVGIACAPACGDDGGGDTGASTTGSQTSGPTTTAGSETVGESGTSAGSQTGESSGAESSTAGESSGSTGTSGVDSSSDGSGSSTGGGVSIPDPGDAMDDWFSQGYIGTPGDAWPVGVATMEQPYIEGTVARDGNAFFVFEAGPALTTFSVFVFAVETGDPEFIHLHDGTGLVFGAEIPPDDVQPTGGTWTVVPGNVYVLEIHFPGAGFF